MNALQKLSSVAGQKVHERRYGATWIWNHQQFPCTHGDINQNPPLVIGGFSPATDVTVTIRTELFGDLLPHKGDDCSLVINARNETFALKVGTVTTAVGDPFLKILCTDVNEGA